MVGGWRGEVWRLEEHVDLSGGRHLAVLVVDTDDVFSRVFHRALSDRQTHDQLLRDLHSAQTLTRVLQVKGKGADLHIIIVLLRNECST